MATIGRITVAFDADTSGLLSGVEESASSIEKLASDVSKMADSVSSASGGTVAIKTAVDTSSVVQARQEIEDLSTEIEVSIDSDSVVDEVKKAVADANRDKDSLTVQIYAEAKEVVAEAAAAAKEVRSFGLGIYRPIEGSATALREVYDTTNSVRKSLSQATAVVGDFAASLGRAGNGGEGLRNTIVFAASLSRSLLAAKSGYESLSESASKFSGYTKALTAFGSSQERLTESLSAGGAAFAASAVSASAYKASMAAVNKTTEDLSPPVREATRYLAGLAIAYGQAELASRTSAAASSVLQSALTREFDITSAAANFLKTYAAAAAEVAESSTSAADRAKLYAKAAEIASSATSSVAGLLGQARKVFLSFVLASAGAAKSAYDFAAGIVSTVRNSAATESAISSLSAAITATGNAFKRSLNSFSAGRQIYSALELSYKAIASSSADLIGYTKALGSAFQSAFAALPGASSIAKGLSNAFAELTSTTSSFASSLPSLTQALGGLVRLFTIGAVFSGKYRESLAAFGGEVGGIQDLADRFGSSTQELQALTKAARDAGVSIAILARGQQAVFTSIGKIKVGQINTEATREAKIAFDRLGISIQDLKDKSPQEIFNEVADKLTDVEDASEKSAIAFDLFGAKGAAILPALKNLKEGRDDVARLGTALGEVEFAAFDDLDKSFKRVGEASKNLSRIMLLPLVPIQTGFNNFFADLQGGVAAAIAPFQSLAAAASVPLQVILEVAGRIINVLLRMVGAVGKVITSFATATTMAAVWKTLGSAIKDALSYFETGVAAVEKLASAISSSVAPSIESMTRPAKTFGEWLEKIGTAATYFAGLVAATAATKIAFAAMGTTGSASFLAIAKSSILANLSLKAFLSGALSLFKLMTIGSVNMAANVVASFVLMGVSAMSAWIAPFLAAVASFVTGTTVAATAATVSGYAMAAAWVVATLGIAAIGVAIVAVIQNFDSLYEYFSNFSENVTKLFTWDGLADAAKSVVNAIKGVFSTLGSWVGGFFGKIWSNVKRSFASVKVPPKIDAAASSAREIVEQRRRVAQADFDADRTVAVNFGMGGAAGSEPVASTEDYDALADSISKSRDRMARLSFAAAAFGESGSKAAIAAQTDFDKLLQKLSEGTIDPEKFEKEAERIQRSLAENINLGDAISNEEKQKFYSSLQDAGRQARKAIRDISAGSVVEGNFFPTSGAIKKQAAEFERQYAERRKEIAMKASRGEYGDGEQGRENMRAAVEDADREFKRNMDKVSRETSFAEQIRKDLYSAFMSPTDAFEKRLREIANNSELTDMEKLMATSREQQRFVESTFGKTQAEQFSEREKALNAATRDGRRAISPQREAAERRKLAADRMQAAGLELDPSQQLQLGVDKIQDAFNVAGLSLAEIQKRLSPEDFDNYQKAIAQNRDKILEGLGVQEAAIVSLKNLKDDLKDAGATAEETSQALRKAGESFMQSLGIEQTPFEKFSSSLDNIADQFDMTGVPIDQVREKLKGNATELAMFDRAVKTARDNLLASLGVQKSPQDVLNETLDKIAEAENATDPNKRITREEANQARIQAFQKRDEALGAGDNATFFGAEIAKQQKAIEEAFGDGKDPEKFALAMDKLRKSIPGSEPDSPVVEFQNQLKKLEEVRGIIGEEDFQQRKLNLQAQLQEDLAPQIDLLQADRRQVQGSDVRSREGVDTFFRLIQGQDNPTLKAQLEVARNTRLMAQALAEPEAAVVVAQLPAR